MPNNYSMQFVTNHSCDCYDEAGGKDMHLTPLGKLDGGNHYRVVEVWVYDTQTKSVKEVKANEISSTDTRYKKWLRISPTQMGGPFVEAKECTYEQNFRGDYDVSAPVNMKGVAKEDFHMLFGPNEYAESKYPGETQRGILAGTQVKILRTYKDWYFVSLGTDGTSGWVKQDKFKDITKNSGTEAGKDAIGHISGAYEGYDPSVARKDNSPKTITGDGTKKLALDGSGIKVAEDPGIMALIKSAGIYNRDEIRWYDRFNRFGCIDPYNNVTSTREYVFFTKPDLNLFGGVDYNGGLSGELATIALFKDAYERYRPVLKELQYSVDRSNPFMNILSNAIKSSIELPGINAQEIETSANIYGTTLSYRRASNNSDEAFDFSTEFEDTKYLEVYMLFKIFDEYERRKIWGQIGPPDITYIYRKILHDQISIYKFIVGEDGTSLLYWAKLIGCYPKSVPRETFSDMSSTGGLNFSIQWRAQFVEDMDPQILIDFNTLVRPKYQSTKELPLYDLAANCPDGRWAAIPYISTLNKTSSPEDIRHKYFLKWRI